MRKADNVVKIELNMPKILDKVTNDELGYFTINGLYRGVGPYTPHRTGLMQERVKMRPWELEYFQPWSAPNYYGTNRNFRRDFNPFATDHWDIAWEQAGGKKKLIKSINNDFFKNRSD